MRTIAALVRRELGVYFVSPLAYIKLTSLMLIFGLLFLSETKRASDYSLPFVFSNLLGSMAGTFGAETRTVTTGSNTFGIAIGDIDRDGKLDVVVGTTSPSPTLIYRMVRSGCGP